METISDEYRIEPFEWNPDNMHELAELIRVGFLPHANSTKGVYLSFTEETFDLMFGSPYLGDSLMLRVVYIPTGEIVGFTGGIPRKLAYKDHIYRMGISTWQVVHHAHQRKSLRLFYEYTNVANRKGKRYSMRICDL